MHLYLDTGGVTRKIEVISLFSLCNFSARKSNLKTRRQIFFIRKIRSACPSPQHIYYFLFMRVNERTKLWSNAMSIIIEVNNTFSNFWTVCSLGIRGLFGILVLAVPDGSDIGLGKVMTTWKSKRMFSHDDRRMELTVGVTARVWSLMPPWGSSCHLKKQCLFLPGWRSV